MGGEAAGEPPACALAHPGGVADHQLTSGGRQREYRLFVPDSYDGATRLPLMLNLHGTGGTAAGQAQDSGMERLAQEEGFIVIGLQGFQNSWNVLMNDPNQVDAFRAAVRDVMDVAGPHRCVVWTNIVRPPVAGASYAGFNRALLQESRSRENLRVVNWVRMVRENPQWVVGDGVHVNADGYRARAKAIARSVRRCR